MTETTKPEITIETIEDRLDSLRSISKRCIDGIKNYRNSVHGGNIDKVEITKPPASISESEMNVIDYMDGVIDSIMRDLGEIENETDRLVLAIPKRMTDKVCISN